MTTDAKINTEKERRQQVLSDYGLNVRGWGVLQTYFVYDCVTAGMGRVEQRLYARGWKKLAVIISKVKVRQHFQKGAEIFQIVTIAAGSTKTTFEQYVHDQDPGEAYDYIRGKYFGLELAGYTKYQFRIQQDPLYRGVSLF